MYKPGRGPLPAPGCAGARSLPALAQQQTDVGLGRLARGVQRPGLRCWARPVIAKAGAVVLASLAHCMWHKYSLRPGVLLGPLLLLLSRSARGDPQSALLTALHPRCCRSRREHRVFSHRTLTVAAAAAEQSETTERHRHSRTWRRRWPPAIRPGPHWPCLKGFFPDLFQLEVISLWKPLDAFIICRARGHLFPSVCLQ